MAGNEVAPPAIGYIGVTLAQTPDGIQVQEVQPDTPADTAGIRAGDVLRTVNGTKVRTTNQLSSVLRDLSPGTAATIVLDRNGSEVTVDLVLAQRPDA
jgi:S1-C subfamily serine protease